MGWCPPDHNRYPVTPLVQTVQAVRIKHVIGILSSLSCVPFTWLQCSDNDRLTFTHWLYLAYTDGCKMLQPRCCHTRHCNNGQKTTTTKKHLHKKASSSNDIPNGTGQSTLTQLQNNDKITWTINTWKRSSWNVLSGEYFVQSVCLL